MRKCLPEIKKEISRKGSLKSAEKVLQISQKKNPKPGSKRKSPPPETIGGGPSL